MKKLILSLFALLVFAISGCNAVAIQYTSPIYALGTIIDVTFYNENNYMEHYNKIKSLYQRVDRVSSDFSSNPSRNSVYDLNQKREVEADPLLVDMVTRAIELKKETKGYFNPFIGRLSHIWKDAIRDKKLPDKALIEAEVEIMNNTSIQVEGNKLTLIGDGNLDLGGMAKGYATELVKDYLEKNKVTGYLVNAGRSNIICGDKAGKSFKIGVSEPLTGELAAYVNGKNISLATSSVEMQNVIIDNELYHHLISPFSGYPVNNMDGITINIDSPLKGDVYSTALFLMEIDEVKKLDLEVIIFKNKQVVFDGINSKE